MAEISVEQADQVAAGWEALARGAWAQASEHFQAALAAAETAEALEGLGAAAFWLDDPQTLEIRERAYRAYRECGDRAGAARAALALSWDTLAFRGDDAVAKGWLELAGRLLEGLPTAPEHGWLAMQTADFAIEVEHDPVEAQLGRPDGGDRPGHRGVRHRAAGSCPARHLPGQPRTGGRGHAAS